MKNIINSIFLSNSNIILTNSNQRKFMATTAFFIITIVMNSIFIIINSIQESYVMVAIEGAFLFPLVLGLYLLQKNYKIERLATFATSLLFAISILILIVRNGADYTLIWLFIFPFVAMVLQGVKKGLYFSILFYSLSFIIAYSYIDETITMPGYIRFVALAIILTSAAFVNEYITQYTFSMLNTSINEVEDLNQNLELKIEEKIQEERLLLSLFDKGETVLFKWNCDDGWSIADVSLSVEALIGYTKEEMMEGTMKYISFISKDDINRVENEVKTALEEGIEFLKHEPYRVITRDGHIKWVLDYTSIVKDKEGQVTNYIGVISDITELKEQEKLLEQQSRLAQMGEMISMIAHQWRQPLGAISVTSANLQTQIELEKIAIKNEDDKEYLLNKLVNINTYVQTLSTTIDDFRNFYRPKKEVSIVTLETVILNSLNIMTTSFISNNIEVIQEHFSQEKFKLYKGEMMQVILNILKNAEDNFIEKGIENPKITIKTEASFILICDNGGGIPQDVINKIFDPYYSTKSEKNGTGLGLYMSKIIVQEHHNGILNVYNDDFGACFSINLEASLNT